MSFTLLNETKPVARKARSCIWCPEMIEKGQAYVREASTYDGEFQDHSWHPECKEAADIFFRKEGECEFEAHACKRGTSEES